MASQPAKDRRLKRRFLMDREASYKVLRGTQAVESGSARVLNISSSGVLFQAESDIQVGLELELSIDWPVALNNSCALKLMVFGSIIRCKDHQIAATISRYEFRTRGSRLVPQRAIPGLDLRPAHP